jgi:hypothetical protein
MSDNIPVTFELKGKTYSGNLSQVSGAGATAMFFLDVDGYHYGQLSFVTGHPGFEGGIHAVEPGWRFSSNSHPELSELAEYFGSCVVSGLDSHS